MGKIGNKRSGSPRRFGVIMVIIILTAALGLSAWAGYRALPEPGAVLPLPGIQIDLLTPDNGLETLPGAPVQVAALLLSDHAIVRVELWADGTLVETREYLSGVLTPQPEDWIWLAGAPGPHVLVVRAMDENGLIGQSAPRLVSVLYAPSADPYTAKAGESLESIAAKLGMTPGALGAANPGLDPSAPLPEGQPVSLPGTDQSAPPPPPAGQTPGDPPGKLEVAFNDFASMLTGDLPPGPPKLEIGAQGCSVQLVLTPLTDDALGYSIFGFKIADQTFIKLADLGPGQDPLGPIAWTDPAPVLTHIQYFAIAFNAAGTAPSNFVGITPAANQMEANGCFGPAGDGSIIQGQLLTATFAANIPVEQSYCYLTTGNGDWFRYPSSDFQFFQQGPLTGLESFLQSAAEPTQMKAECWGWQGGALQYLGEASVAYPPNPVTPQIEIKNENFTIEGPGLGGPGYNPGLASPSLLPLLEKKVPAPVNLRPAGSKDVCEAHNGYTVSPSPCNQIDSSLSTYNVLVWDWAPETCWGTCEWNNNITGFRIIRIHKKSLSKPAVIADTAAGVTTAAIPKPWAGQGDDCYIVKAYAVVGGIPIYSAGSNTYCLESEPPVTKTVTINASNWITTTDIWSDPTGDDCYAGNDTKGMWDDQVMVGVYDGTYGDCGWDQRHYDAAVKFDLLAAFPVGTQISIQKAILNFNMITPIDYAGSFASPAQPMCATDLGYERLAWEGWDPAAARAGKTDMLSWGTNASPYLQLQPFGDSKGHPTRYDVTQAVIYWLKNPSLNHGFVMWVDYNDLATLGINPSASIYTCRVKLWGFNLTIDYYDVP